MTWPQLLDFVEAIQAPSICFRDPQLSTASVLTTSTGMPAPATGKSAIVFRLNVAGKPLALRCFTRSTSDQKMRYEALQRQLGPLTPPFMLDFQYVDEGIWIKGNPYPIVRMGWAEGSPLHMWVERNLGNTSSLHRLAREWLEVVASLGRMHVGHGDLANDNVFVDGFQIFLIDYDGCFVPALSGHPPLERGNQNFQHPDRMRTGHFAENIDAFGAAVIYVSLRALAGDASLWRFHTGENLIFSAADFANPGGTEVWYAAEQHASRETKRLLSILAAMCQTEIAALTLDPLTGETQSAKGADWWSSWQRQARRRTPTPFPKSASAQGPGRKAPTGSPKSRGKAPRTQPRTTRSASSKPTTPSKPSPKRSEAWWTTHSSAPAPVTRTRTTSPPAARPSRAARKVRGVTPQALGWLLLVAVLVAGVVVYVMQQRKPDPLLAHIPGASVEECQVGATSLFENDTETVGCRVVGRLSTNVYYALYRSSREVRIAFGAWVRLVDPPKTSPGCGSGNATLTGWHYDNSEEDAGKLLCFRDGSGKFWIVWSYPNGLVLAAVVTENMSPNDLLTVWTSLGPNP